MVLSLKGGVLPKMLTPFAAGVGGPLGDPDAYFSFITIDDLLDVILRAAQDDSLHGPLNAVGPRPVTQRELASTLGLVLHRPALLTTPKTAIRLALGREKADETALSSIRAIPKKLLDAGHEFRHPDMEAALRHTLGRWK
jgi:NAD dependent epimerase/dehydratase family enzyme